MMTFFLDGAQVTPPTNWQEVASTIKRDNNLNLFLLYQEYDLEFDADGYDYLIDKINNDSFCTQVTLDIYRDCGPTDQRLIFSGIMFISDCTVNERNATVKCKVNDRSFFSKINNNKNIKTSLEGASTKLGLPITQIQQYDLDVYKVTDNTLWKAIPACRVEEAFRYLVEFMTDNSIGFVSDTFGATGDWNGLCITVGVRLRGVTPTLYDARWTPFSFIKLFEEVNKRIPIILIVENPYTAPLVRIESIEYLNRNNINFIAGNIDEIETSYDTNKLFAIVKFGSPTDDTAVLNFPEGIDFFGFKEEEFHLLTTCNLDQTLDLTCDWVTSSNIIERVVGQTGTPADQGYDKDLFLINSIYTDDFNGRTTNDNFIAANPPRYHYNYLLSNSQIADRYVDDLASQIASYYINNQDGQAYGYRTGSNQSITGSSPFTTPQSNTVALNAESFDYGGYFDPVTYTYTALTTAAYTIKAKVTALYVGAGPNLNLGLFMFYLRHYNSSNALIAEYRMYNANNSFYNTLIVSNFQSYGGAGCPMIFNGSTDTRVINMGQGDYLRLETYYEPYTPPGSAASGTNVDVKANATDTFIECVTTSLTGGVFLNVNPNQLRVQLHKFSYPMTQSEFEVILNDPTGRIGFNMNGQPLRYGWIKELKYNHTNSVAQFVITTNKQSQNAS